MFKLLAAYLDAAVTPEQRSMCLSACEALVEAGMEDHAFVIEQQLTVAEQLDGDFLLLLVDGTLRPIYTATLSEFGVRLSDDATLSQMTDVLKGLHAIDNFEDRETIVDYSDSSDGPEAALSDILAMVGSYTAAEYLTFVEYVSPSLMDRIAEVCKVETSEATIDLAVVERSRTRLQKLLAVETVAALPQLLVTTALADGARLGLPLTSLIAPFMDTLETVTPAQMAVELVGFALASNSEDGNLPTEIAVQLDQLPLDMTKVTSVAIAAKKLLSQVTNG